MRTPISVYGDHESLGKRVIVVGGSETGTETGMYLAENGHEVVVLTRQLPPGLRRHAHPLRGDGPARLGSSWRTSATITDVTTTAIAKGKVTYIDADGAEKTLECDDIVLAGGMEPRYDEALAFYGTADRFFMIGDCTEVGSVQTCMRTALGAVSQL